jgi:hypothetical protein
MIVTEENPSTQSKPCPTATLSTTNPTHWPAIEPKTLEVKGQQVPKPTKNENEKFHERLKPNVVFDISTHIIRPKYPFNAWIQNTFVFVVAVNVLHEKNLQLEYRL